MVLKKFIIIIIIITIIIIIIIIIIITNACTYNLTYHGQDYGVFTADLLFYRVAVNILWACLEQFDNGSSTSWRNAHTDEFHWVYMLSDGREWSI